MAKIAGCARSVRSDGCTSGVSERALGGSNAIHLRPSARAQAFPSELTEGVKANTGRGAVGGQVSRMACLGSAFAHRLDEDTLGLATRSNLAAPTDLLQEKGAAATRGSPC